MRRMQVFTAMEMDKVKHGLKTRWLSEAAALYGCEGVKVWKKIR